jgi:hypothetical protein
MILFWLCRELGGLSMEIIGRLLKRILHYKTDDDPYIETLKRLGRAMDDLMNTEDYIKEKLEELYELDVIKYRLERLKEIIEDMERIIQKAQDSRMRDREDRIGGRNSC